MLWGNIFDCIKLLGFSLLLGWSCANILIRFCEHMPFFAHLCKHFRADSSKVFLTISAYIHSARKYSNFFHRFLSLPLPLCLQTTFTPFVNSFLQSSMPLFAQFCVNVFAQNLLSIPKQNSTCQNFARKYFSINFLH